MPIITLKDGSQSVADVSFKGFLIEICGCKIDCELEQCDSQVAIEVRRNKTGEVEIGGDGDYVAIVKIPAKRYENKLVIENGEEVIAPIAVPLNKNSIEIELWPFAEV